MENQELINELYERIFSLKDTMYKQEVVIDNVRKKIMTSHIPIEEGMFIMNVINFLDTETCLSESYFLSKECTNQELRRVLNL